MNVGRRRMNSGLEACRSEFGSVLPVTGPQEEPGFGRSAARLQQPNRGQADRSRRAMRDHRFSERASFLLGYQIRTYDDEVLKNPGVSPDLLAATPLQGHRTWGGTTRSRTC